MRAAAPPRSCRARDSRRRCRSCPDRLRQPSRKNGLPSAWPGSPRAAPAPVSHPGPPGPLRLSLRASAAPSAWRTTSDPRRPVAGRYVATSRIQAPGMAPARAARQSLDRLSAQWRSSATMTMAGDYSARTSDAAASHARLDRADRDRRVVRRDRLQQPEDEGRVLVGSDRAPTRISILSAMVSGSPSTMPKPAQHLRTGDRGSGPVGRRQAFRHVWAPGSRARCWNSSRSHRRCRVSRDSDDRTLAAHRGRSRRSSKLIARPMSPPFGRRPSRALGADEAVGCDG